MEEEDFFDNIMDKNINASLLDENNDLDEYLLNDDIINL